MGTEAAKLTTAMVATGFALLVVGLPLRIFWRTYRATLAELAHESEQPDPAAYHELVRDLRWPVRYLAVILLLTVAGVWACYAAGVSVGYGFVPLGLALLHLRLVAFGRRVARRAGGRRVRPTAGPAAGTRPDGARAEAEPSAAADPARDSASRCS